jgi:hypothetical protein
MRHGDVRVHFDRFTQSVQCGSESAEKEVSDSEQSVPAIQCGIARAQPWSTRFEDPIVCPRAGSFGHAEGRGGLHYEAAEKGIRLAAVQTAIEALMLCSRGGPTMMARIGVMRALNRHVERVFDPDRKDTHWGKRKLKRDQ